jgi:hypothetical protein
MTVIVYDHCEVELVQILRRLIRGDNKNKKQKGPKLNQTSLSSPSTSTSLEGHGNLHVPASACDPILTILSDDKKMNSYQL